MPQASQCGRVAGSQLWTPEPAQGFHHGSPPPPKKRPNSTFSCCQPPGLPLVKLPPGACVRASARAPRARPPLSAPPSPLCPAFPSFLLSPPAPFPSLHVVRRGVCVRVRARETVESAVSSPCPCVRPPPCSTGACWCSPCRNTLDSQSRCPPLGCPGCPGLGLALMGGTGPLGGLVGWRGVRSWAGARAPRWRSS